MFIRWLATTHRHRIKRPLQCGRVHDDDDHQPTSHLGDDMPGRMLFNQTALEKLLNPSSVIHSRYFRNICDALMSISRTRWSTYIDPAAQSPPHQHLHQHHTSHTRGHGRHCSGRHQCMFCGDLKSLVTWCTAH
jgi:hypothetical protein